MGSQILGLVRLSMMLQGTSGSMLAGVRPSDEESCTKQNISDEEERQTSEILVAGHFEVGG